MTAQSCTVIASIQNCHPTNKTSNPMLYCCIYYPSCCCFEKSKYKNYGKNDATTRPAEPICHAKEQSCSLTRLHSWTPSHPSSRAHRRMGRRPCERPAEPEVPAVAEPPAGRESPGGHLHTYRASKRHTLLPSCAKQVVHKIALFIRVIMSPEWNGFPGRMSFSQ